MSPGFCVGRHPIRSCVSTLGTGASIPAKAHEPAEMTGRPLGEHGDDEGLRAPADGFGDRSDRHTLLGDRGRMSA